MSPLGFEPTKWTGERPQTYALDRAATGTGILCISNYNIVLTNNNFGRLKHLILLFRISMGTRKNMLPAYKKFGHAPSKSFACPDAVTGLWRNVFRFPEGKWFIAAASIAAVRPTQPPTKWRSFPGGGGWLPGRGLLEADHSPQSISCFKNEWSYISIPLCAMIACTWINLPVQF
jgi:hypothetical protein